MACKLCILFTALLLAQTPAAAQTDAQERVRHELRHAESLERAGQYSRARSALETLLLEAPAEPGAILAYERISRRQGRLEAVLRVVERAIEVDPESALLRQVQLRVLADLALTGEMSAAGERWLQIAPRSDVAYQEYAASLQRVGEYAEAEVILLEGLRQVDRPAALFGQLADLYTAERRWLDAAGQWLALVESSPEVGWELVNSKLGFLGLESGIAAEAILERLPERPASVAEHKLASIAALHADRPEEARRLAEDLMGRLEAPERERFVAVFAKVAAGRRQEAIVAWAYRRMLLDVASDSVRWDLARLVVQYDLSAGDTTAALETLDQVLQRSNSGTPEHRWASGTQVQVSAAQGDGDRAERGLARHVEMYADDPMLLTLALAVAELNMRQGRIDEATKVLGLVSSGGASAALVARLAATRGLLALYRGAYEEARTELQVAAAGLSGAQRGEALRFLGFVRRGCAAELEAVAKAHRGLLEGQQRRTFDRLMDDLDEATASSARPAILLWAGEFALNAGYVDRAERVLRSIPELYSASGEAPVALVTLAEALAAEGRPMSAIELLETLILEYPESALTPLGRRRMAELKEEVPRS